MVNWMEVSKGGGILVLLDKQATIPSQNPASIQLSLKINNYQRNILGANQCEYKISYLFFTYKSTIFLFFII